MRAKIYTINKKAFIRKMSNAEKRIARMGGTFHCEAVSSGSEKVMSTTKKGETFYTGNIATFTIYEVEGKASFGDDWELAGMVHKPETSDGISDSNVIEVVNRRLQIPPKYFFGDIVCDHCGSDHFRKKGFLFYNSRTGEWREIGSTCVQDYFGVDAEFLARFYSNFHLLEQSGLDNIRNRNGNMYAMDTRYFLNACIAVLNEEGYQKGFGNMVATRLSLVFDPIHNDKEQKEDKELITSIHEIEKTEEADKIIRWALSQPEDYGYFHNVRAILANGEFFNKKYANFIGALPHSYRQSLTREMQKGEKSANEYLGNVGDKVTFTVKTHEVRRTGQNAYYGDCFLHTFTDTEGHKIIWFTTNATLAMKQNGHVVEVETPEEIKATIKRCDKYKGICETVITRAQVTKGTTNKDDCKKYDNSTEWKETEDMLRKYGLL